MIRQASCDYAPPVDSPTEFIIRTGARWIAGIVLIVFTVHPDLPCKVYYIQFYIKLSIVDYFISFPLHCLSWS